MFENRSMLPDNITGCARSVSMEAHVWCGADRWSCPAPWRSILLDNGDIRSYLADWTPAPPLPGMGWVGSSRSPFSADGDLAGTLVLFSPSVRNMRCSQVGYA